MHPERPLLRLTPRVQGRSWQYYVLAPVVLIVVGPFVLAYKLFLGWWLNPLLYKRDEGKLREEVTTDLAFLFQEFGGLFVPSERAEKNVIVVTIEAADLRVVVYKHHGDYRINVARRASPEIAESLDSLLEVVYEKDRSIPKPSYVNLAELGELFRNNFEQVRVALSREHYPETLATINENHESGMRMSK